jgi:L-lactate dehydrogenase complex protein LldG
MAVPGVIPGPMPATGPRSAVLERVREALASAPLRSDVVRQYRRAGQSGVNDPLALFCERLGDYKAQVTRVRPEAVGAAVAAALEGAGSDRIVVPADLPADWVPDGLAAARQGFVVERDNGALTAAELDGFDAAVSGCALAIAETGTIVLDGGVRQGRRALSLVPDHLVVVVFAGQVVGGVPDAVARLDPRTPQTWISGPSATSDIELNRVEGVHGPRRLDVLMVLGR